MLLAGLPPLVRVNVRGSNAGTWLEASVRYALAEARSPRPGGAGVLAKLAEVLFIEVLRLYMNEQSAGRTGWLAGVGDRIVGAALNALQQSAGARVDARGTGARSANTSRSVLAERFQHLVGSSPMQYLTQWRMLLAANLLCRSNAPLVAHRRGRRLPDRHGVQPRVPARVRRAAGGVAPQPDDARARQLRVAAGSRSAIDASRVSVTSAWR